MSLRGLAGCSHRSKRPRSYR